MCIKPPEYYSCRTIYKTVTQVIDAISSFVWDVDKMKKDLDFRQSREYEFNCGQSYKVTIERVK